MDDWCDDIWSLLTTRDTFLGVSGVNRAANRGANRAMPDGLLPAWAELLKRHPHALKSVSTRYRLCGSYDVINIRTRREAIVVARALETLEYFVFSTQRSRLVWEFPQIPWNKPTLKLKSPLTAFKSGLIAHNLTAEMFERHCVPWLLKNIAKTAVIKVMSAVLRSAREDLITILIGVTTSHYDTLCEACAGAPFAVIDRVRKLRSGASNASLARLKGMPVEFYIDMYRNPLNTFDVTNIIGASIDWFGIVLRQPDLIGRYPDIPWDVLLK